MLVKDWMSKDLITVKANDSVVKAQTLLLDRNISRLPVMEEEHLLGIITDREIRKVLIPSETLRVKNLMTRNPVTVPWNYTIGETAEILLKHDISGAPVVDHQDRVVGIITKGDLFRVLVPLTGVGKKGIHFALRLTDRRGAIKEVTDVIREHGGRMMSVLTAYDAAPTGTITLYLRMYGLERKKFKTLKKILSETATMLYIVDYREDTREFYFGADNKKPVGEAVY
jgi:acetoin utilization protein AcuB